MESSASGSVGNQSSPTESDNANDPREGTEEVETEDPRNKKRSGTKKRKRVATFDPPPFAWLSSAASKRRRDVNYRRYVRLAAVLGERVAEHDWAMVAPIASVLARKYHSRTSLTNRSYPREITWAIVDALRVLKTMKESEVNVESTIEAILRAAVEAPDSYSVSGASVTHRTAAGIELLFHQVRQGEKAVALKEASARSILSPFRDSAVYHWAVGSLALYIAQADEVQPKDGQWTDEMTQIAVDELQRALEMEPSVFAYAKKLINAEHLVGRHERAQEVLEKFCEDNPDDVLALEELLQAKPSLSTANQLLTLSPLSARALSIVEVEGPVKYRAEAHASRIEHGDRSGWNSLGNLLSLYPEQVPEHVWKRSPRRNWWPRAYFSSKAATLDVEADLNIAQSKASIAKQFSQVSKNSSMRNYYKKVEQLLNYR
mmetsp:Transcript_9896/g.41907  ORF Transcript_9896/g.41907 Transcript_9896/m.41907 type:complete len:432 (-) Transcript_9896:341-1636(-)|eukprot:CAMPEP_0113969270 /NCGR_PEP_ID=MMETSP0011_2-20120614/10171_1 /TAXON_ID=101924 /ORGANISM="Rhodosorus marinus" /LENGTH=431 /DNA_ID=CAMNT_0000982803 /DNA_START=88 /DNA_END=1383 /DNA_ORIENTATION=+ /assembly_acc=CAM_ASM_000156